MQQQSPDDLAMMQRVSADSLSERGLYVDPAAIVGSGLLLIILLALSFERVLGLDRVWMGMLRWVKGQLGGRTCTERLRPGTFGCVRDCVRCTCATCAA